MTIKLNMFLLFTVPSRDIATFGTGMWPHLELGGVFIQDLMMMLIFRLIHNAAFIILLEIEGCRILAMMFDD
jgi:hypothetical protein